MNLHTPPRDYGADAVCRTMQFSGFIEEHWMQTEQATVRILLKPAFDPELCITATERSGDADLEVVALLDSFWRRGDLVCLPCVRDGGKITLDAFQEVTGLISTAYASLDESARSVTIDGMGRELCLVSKSRTLRIEDNLQRHQLVSDLIVRLIELAWSACQRPTVRRALSDAAAYLGVKYARPDCSEEMPVTNIAILGTAEARQEYFEMLRRHKDGKDR